MKIETMIDLPSNPADREKIVNELNQIALHLTAKNLLDDKIKDIADFLKEKYKLKPAQVKKVAKLITNRSFKAQDVEHEAIRELYTLAVGDEENEQEQD